MISAFFFLLFSLVQVPEYNVAMAARQMDQVAPAPEGHALLGFQILFSIVCILLSMFIGYKAANMIWAAWGIKDWRGELGGVILCGVSGFIFLLPILLFMLMDLYLLP